MSPSARSRTAYIEGVSLHYALSFQPKHYRSHKPNTSLSLVIVCLFVEEVVAATVQSNIQKRR